ncbi:MAG: hypothetical protein PHY92_06020 [Alphaproteobacteria bacterium]|nr:hypothetical protein [Alphaproteobacteria bacterium]
MSEETETLAPEERREAMRLLGERFAGYSFGNTIGPKRYLVYDTAGRVLTVINMSPGGEKQKRRAKMAFVLAPPLNDAETQLVARFLEGRFRDYYAPGMRFLAHRAGEEIAVRTKETGVKKGTQLIFEHSFINLHRLPADAKKVMGTKWEEARGLGFLVLDFAATVAGWKKWARANPCTPAKPLSPNGPG